MKTSHDKSVDVEGEDAPWEVNLASQKEKTYVQ